MLGTLIVNEIPFAVTSIRLGDGRIYFTASRQAPPDGELVVHDQDQAVLLAPDGTEIMHCLLVTGGVVARAYRGGWMTIDLPTSLDAVGSAAWPKESRTIFG